MPKKSSKPSDALARQKPHIISPEELSLYAQSFHQSAKTLAAAFQAVPTAFPDIDVSPLVFLYRHAIELQLKAIVLGNGGDFLPVKPDRISVSQSHAISWLANFLRQILTLLKWEQAFTCEGIQNLADFKETIDRMTEADPGLFIYRQVVDAEAKNSVPRGGKLTVSEFVRRMDALLGLLSRTADALATEWELKSGPAGRTIH